MALNMHGKNVFRGNGWFQQIELEKTMQFVMALASIAVFVNWFRHRALGFSVYCCYNPRAILANRLRIAL